MKIIGFCLAVKSRGQIWVIGRLAYFSADPYQLTGTYLLRYQAEQILLLSDEQAQRVADEAP